MKTRNIILALAASVLTLGSCDQMLDIPQHGVQNYETYYNTDEEAEAAIVACYLQVQGNSYNALLGKNMLTEDFWAGGASRADNAELEQLNEFTFATDQGQLQGMFQSYYGIIYKANVVLGHVPEETDVQLRARAEAKVFRAWSYFELISMWGNPPLVDHELEPSEYHKPNGTTEELWALVEKDLTEAIASGKLAEKSGANDKTWRVTKQYAQALLGKAYLWQKKYAEAAEIFDEIVASGKYELYHDYENVLGYSAKQNSEIMFQSVRISDPNNPYNNFYNLTGVMVHFRTDCLTAGSCEAIGLSDSGWGFLSPKATLYEDFVKVEGENGYRLNATMKTYEQMKEMGVSVLDGKTIINEGYFMWKWRFTAEQTIKGVYGMLDDNNFTWMRYSEVLLCAAEAHLMNNNVGKADEYMNMVRTRAQAPAISGTKLEDIQREKRIELCGECVRFQDLLRWEIADDKMKDQGGSYPTLAQNGSVTYVPINDSDPNKYGFKDKHNLLPYPGVEIRLNPNITQNPGW